MCFYLSVFHQQNNVILLLNNTCVEFISIKLPWEHQIKKLQNYPSVRKSYSTSSKAIGGCKNKEKIKSKTTTLTYFDNLKKKQQDQAGKNWC